MVETRSETVFRFKTNHDDGPLNYDVILGSYHNLFEE
jgi:hypothetical protein